MINTKKDINTNQNIHKYLLVMFYISIFLLPTNLFLVWRLPESFIQGHFIDYLAPKIYLSQIMLGVLALVWAAKMQVATRCRQLLGSFFQDFAWRKHVSLTSLLLLVGILLIQAVRWQDIGLLSLTLNFIAGPVFLGFFLWRERELARKHLFGAMGIATTFQALLGLVQWWRQDSLLGYWFLGEPNLRLPEVMTSSLPGAVQILPYGTTPHPNILAGWLVLGSLCLIQFRKGKSWKKWMHTIFLAIFAIHLFTLLLTESWVAGASLVLLLLYSLFSAELYRFLKSTTSRLGISISAGIIGTLFMVQLLWLVFPLVLERSSMVNGIIEQTSLTRRSRLQSQSLDLLQTEPSGSGFKRIFQYILTTEDTYIGTRFLQPPHNSSVLLVTMSGFWVLIVLIYYSRYEHDVYSLINVLILFSIPIFNLDHYFISTISGQYSSIILIVYLYVLHGIEDL